MEFTIVEVIPDLPETLMRICATFGVQVCITTDNELDDDHNSYQDMRVTLKLGSLDVKQNEITEMALNACPEYTANFKGEEPYYQSWHMDDVDDWVERWAIGMEHRFPKVSFV